MYQTGKLDAVLLGGDVHYGKLHAKFIVEDDSGFIGTSNFDYRSRLYNNEMGFFFEDEALARELNEWFDMLKSSSYRWGTPEWLELRRQVAATGGLKGIATANQRPLFKTLRAMGMDWLF
jgi:phosphatidylserine/phosphatidylglycerophosphate/cardiolipin synthase-like enzyme